MAIKKNAPLQPLVDQAVQAAIGAGGESDPVYSGLQRLQQAKTMSPGKVKKKARDKARTKVTFDWPAWLIERLEALASEDDNTFPMNQLAAVLAIEGLRSVERGALVLEERKYPSRTPAFRWFLRVDDEGEL